MTTVTAVELTFSSVLGLMVGVTTAIPSEVVEGFKVFRGVELLEGLDCRLVGDVGGCLLVVLP